MPDYNTLQAISRLGDEALRRKGNQRGSVRRVGASWMIRFYDWKLDPEGKPKYVQVERKVGDCRGPERISKTDAERIGYEQFVAKAVGVAKIPQGLGSLGQFIDAHFRPEHMDNLKKGGRLHYETILRNHILPALGTVPLREINPVMVQGLITSKTRAGNLSPQSIFHIRNVLSAILRHARRLKLFQGELPTDDLKLPEMVRKTRRALTLEQLEMLIQAITPRHRLLVALLGATGLRIGEACGLRWKWVNLTDQPVLVDGEVIRPYSILVREQYRMGEWTTLKSRAAKREIPLSSALWVDLCEWFNRSEHRGPDDTVFYGRTGRPLDAHNIASRSLRTAAAKIGLPWVSFHVLRHTYSTLTDIGGVAPGQRQILLGHAQQGVTQQYTHLQGDAIRAALERALSNRSAITL